MKKLLVLALFVMACANTDKAENLAKEFAIANYPGHEINHIQCQGADSDGDGYVSCNISLKTPKGDVITPPLECSGGWVQFFNNGCRFPKPAAIRR